MPTEKPPQTFVIGLGEVLAYTIDNQSSTGLPRFLSELGFGQGWIVIAKAPATTKAVQEGHRPDWGTLLTQVATRWSLCHSKERSDEESPGCRPKLAEYVEILHSYLAQNDIPGLAGNLLLMSFGAATVRWPGHELVEIMSRRWVKNSLKQLLTLSQAGKPEKDLGQQARAIVQQWLTETRLAPPLLMDHLAENMPPLPTSLIEQVPDPPWPWLLVNTRSQLEQVARQWQNDWWAAAGRNLHPTLAYLERDWIRQAEAWLARQATPAEEGVLLVAGSHMAVISELLEAFREGVEQNLQETEYDLAHLDRGIGQRAQAFIDATATLPKSWSATLRDWGLQPWHWGRYRARCGRVQTIAHDFARLTQARMNTLQTIWYFEEILPVYGRLLTQWRQVVKRWEQTGQHVREAIRSSELADESLAGILEASNGPWNEALVDTICADAFEQQAGLIRGQVGMPADWVNEGLEATQIIGRLRDYAGRILSRALAIPVDQMLCRQIPDEEARLEWLRQLIEGAQLRCALDEQAALSESGPVQGPEELWLLLPGAEKSLLAALTRRLSPPPKVLPSPDPEAISIVVIRRINYE